MPADDRCARCGMTRAEVRAGRGRHGGTMECAPKRGRLIPSSEHARWFTESYNRLMFGNPRHAWPGSKDAIALGRRATAAEGD